ncbi:MAG: flagellar hook-associated protein FlgK, partial [Senegalia sp. (in: firmicutes)]|uniref:flagellar hook-associated protein FlgK n=1 Tax=Senegalia sp. (in: firmicutes) TaxID=1924098 RepID=UPI003F9B82BC
MSGWIGFNTAVSGLLASQKNLYTTNHNISNVNTKGYSRQQNTQESNNPHNIAGLGFLGTGTNITEVNRVRDSYLDFKYWGENAPVGEWNIKEEALTEISHVFNEPSDSSIRKNLDEFFTSLESLSTNPGDDANRALVREKMISLTKYINSTAENLKSTQNEINFEVGTNIKKINSYSDRISGLNKEIYLIELNGSSANDLRDSRDLLVDELSEIANINASETNGRFKVSIGGVALVDGEVSNKLKYPAPTIINPLNNEEKLYQLEWENGNKLELKSGTLKGLIDVRDGDGVNQKYRGVPFYMKRLNQFAKTFAKNMNDIHKEGFN